MVGGWRSWPIEVYFPIFLAALLCSAIAPLLHLFLNPHFGLTAGRDAPSMFGFAFVGLVGCWATRLFDRLKVPKQIFPMLSIVVFAASLIIWFALQPDYDVTAALKDPASIAAKNGYFLLPIFISLFAWWEGSRYSLDPGRFAAEEIRGVVQRCWIILTVSIVLAALIGGDAGDAAISAAKWAVPIGMIASVALVGGAEVQGTRELARRRGVQVPGWRRWYRLTGGFTVAIVVFSLVILLLFGPGAMRAVLDGIIFAFRYAGYLIEFALYVLVYAVFLVVRFLDYLFGDFFGSFKPPKVQQPLPPPPSQKQQIPEHQPGGFEHALLIRWIAIGIALVIVAIIIFRLSRRGQTELTDGVMEEERDSVFSADLAKKQLRDLFRRRHGPAAPSRLDLDRPPATAREAMLYLEVLANREGVGREEAETPNDFAARLRGIWSGTGGALSDLTSGYHDVRYGDRDESERTRIASAWSQIWGRRKADGPGADRPRDG